MKNSSMKMLINFFVEEIDKKKMSSSAYTHTIWKTKKLILIFLTIEMASVLSGF